MAIVLAQSSRAACARCRSSVRAGAQVIRPFTASRLSPTGVATQQRSVQANFFKFGKNGANAEAAGIMGSQGRDEFTYDDVEAYFNYMGFLAEEGCYDRMEALLASGLHSIDVILLLASSQNDTPKVQEILAAGADPSVKDLDGKTAMELTTKAELRQSLEDALKAKALKA